MMRINWRKAVKRPLVTILGRYEVARGEVEKSVRTIFESFLMECEAIKGIFLLMARLYMNLNRFSMRTVQHGRVFWDKHFMPNGDQNPYDKYAHAYQPM